MTKYKTSDTKLSGMGMGLNDCKNAEEKLSDHGYNSLPKRYKNLTPYRFNSAGLGLDDMKAEIHSFPTMYIMWGGKWGRNGSKLRFSEKKWSKNSFFEGHKFGSTDFGGVWDPYF